MYIVLPAMLRILCARSCFTASFWPWITGESSGSSRPFSLTVSLPMMSSSASSTRVNCWSPPNPLCELWSSFLRVWRLMLSHKTCKWQVLNIWRLVLTWTVFISSCQQEGERLPNFCQWSHYRMQLFILWKEKLKQISNTT